MNDHRGRLSLKIERFSTTVKDENEFGQLVRWMAFVDDVTFAKFAKTAGISPKTLYDLMKLGSAQNNSKFKFMGWVALHWGYSIEQSEIEALMGTKFEDKAKEYLWWETRDRCREARIKLESGT